jgi:hypothetical protein
MVPAAALSAIHRFKRKHGGLCEDIRASRSRIAVRGRGNAHLLSAGLESCTHGILEINPTVEVREKPRIVLACLKIANGGLAGCEESSPTRADAIERL